MGDLIANVLLAALKDGLSPCVVMTASIVIACRLLQRRFGFRLTRYVIVFCLEVMLFGFLMRLSMLAFKDPFHLQGLLYDAVAGVLLIGCVVLLIDRVTMARGLTGLLFWRGQDAAAFKRMRIPAMLGLNMAAMLMAIVVNNKDMQSPLDPFIVAITNNIFAGVVGRLSLWCLLLYTILRFWPVWAVVFLFQPGRLMEQYALMVAAAFLGAAGLSIFYLK